MESSAEETLAEVQNVLGFVPAFLEIARNDPRTLRGLWSAYCEGILENPLPAMFKARFVVLANRMTCDHYGLVIGCCALGHLGAGGGQILNLLKAPPPPQSQIVERIRLGVAERPFKASWASMPDDMQQWVLWAAVRVTLRKDPAGRCRNVLRDALGEESFNALMLLGAFLGTIHIWTDAHPEISPLDDPRVRAHRAALLAEAPEIESCWDRVRRRASATGEPSRNRKLVAEIARQDRIRQALRDSEQRFRRVIGSMPFPVMVYDADGKVLMLNRAWTEQSGWTRGDIPTVQTWFQKGQGGRQVWEPEDIKALEGWNEVVEEGEHAIQTRSGQTRSWDFYTTSVGRLPDGRHAIIRVAADVTERARLEAALWDTNRRMIDIVEAITDGFLAVDREGRYIYVNAQAERILNASRNDMLGRTYLEVFPHLRGTELHKASEACMEDGQNRDLEFFSPRLGAFMEVHLYPSREGGSVFFRDISDRKREERLLRVSDQRLHTLLDSGIAGVVIGDRVSGAILDCNDVMLQLIGYTREDLAAGRLNWMAVTAPEDQAQNRVVREEVRNGPVAPWDKQYMHKDGHRVPVLVTCAPLTPDADTTIALVFARTPQKPAEQGG